MSQPNSASTEKGNTKKIVAGILAIFLLLVGTLAGVRAMKAKDVAAKEGVDKVKELSAQMFNPDNQNMTMAERRELGQQLRAEMEKLPQAKKDELRAEQRKKMTEEMNRFFTLSKEEQNEILDKRIMQMEQMRAQFEAARAQQGADGNKDPNAGNRGPRGGGGDMIQRMSQMISRTTPQERSNMMEMMKRMTERRKELGLPPMTFGGPRPQSAN